MQRSSSRNNVPEREPQPPVPRSTSLDLQVDYRVSFRAIFGHSINSTMPSENSLAASIGSASNAMNLNLDGRSAASWRWRDMGDRGAVYYSSQSRTRNLTTSSSSISLDSRRVDPETPSDTGAVCSRDWLDRFNNRNGQSTSRSRRPTDMLTNRTENQNQANLENEVIVVEDSENEADPVPENVDQVQDAGQVLEQDFADHFQVPELADMLPPPWLRRQVRPSPPDSMDNDLNPNLFDSKPKLSAKGFNRLPRKTFKGNKNHDFCVICQDFFKTGERVIVLICGHVFHEDCAEVWLKSSKKECPVCKSTVSTLSTKFSSSDFDSKDGDDDGAGNGFRPLVTVG